MENKALPLVKKAYQNALDNGITFTGWTPERMAQDMCDGEQALAQYVCVDGEFIEAKFDEVVEAIRQVRHLRYI
jgi:hypothetical protein